MPRVPYYRCTDVAAVLARVAELTPRTVVVDVEPMVASWETGTTELELGVALILGELIAVASVEQIVFATNSSRRLAVTAPTPRVSVAYLAGAFKPLRIRAYRDLPLPGVVVGDQVATDGLLAWRLGYTFVRYRPAVARAPWGPRLMRYLGIPLTPILFR